MNTTWQDDFKRVFEHGLQSYEAGTREPSALWTAEQIKWLASVGCTARELFDFVDDLCRYGEPDYATTLEVAELRRDYFLNVQKGKHSERKASMAALPPKDAVLRGVVWLPRIIEKARIKLRGEMPEDLMYGCGGDRQFLKSIGWSLRDFLTLVRDCGNDADEIATTVLAGPRKRG